MVLTLKSKIDNPFTFKLKQYEIGEWPINSPLG